MPLMSKVFIWHRLLARLRSSRIMHAARRRHGKRRNFAS